MKATFSGFDVEVLEYGTEGVMHFVLARLSNGDLVKLATTWVKVV